MDLGTPAATKVVGTLALLVVAGLGWTFVVGPETGALADARMEVTSVQDQNDVLAAQLVTLERQREGLAETRHSAQELKQLFPPTADQPGLFEQVTAAAESAGIGARGVTALTPTPPVIGGPTTATAPAPADPTDPAAAPSASLARQSVTVTVTGTYDETQRLLENLEHMDRAYLVTAVSLSGDAATAVFTTTITGDMFVMPPVVDPARTLSLASADTTGSKG